MTQRPQKVAPLQARLDDNSRCLLAAYRESVVEIENGRPVVPAAEWLLDNYHLVEAQIREIRDDLPPSYYRQLPKLAQGPFVGYPRVFGLAWAFIAHCDSHFDPDTLRRFLTAYQQVQPLTIGELWAVAITLRIVLIENLRRLTDQISAARIDRQDANNFTDRLLKTGCARSALDADITARATGPISEPFAAQLAKRLRDQDPRTMPALEWLEERLQLQNQSVVEVVQRAHLRQGASNVSIRNIILSMRLISDIDWTELFESVSLVNARLCASSDFAVMDFPTRNLYRSAIEHLAQGSRLSELDITDCLLKTVAQALNDSSHSEKKTDNATYSTERERRGDPGFYLIDEGRGQFEKLIGFKPKFGLRLSRVQVRLGLLGYLGAIAFLTAVFLLYAINILGLMAYGWLIFPVVLVSFLPATDIATAIVNRIVSWRFSATCLPGLELLNGVPTSLRTLIAVPILLTDKTEVLEQVERLEVHFLAGIEGDLSFALLSDGLDADSETLESDASLLTIAVEAIDRLNQRYG
ncbi:MAG TPA: hypothetical protein VIC26_12700, partial [Marinagarivorans sp.]